MRKFLVFVMLGVLTLSSLGWAAVAYGRSASRTVQVLDDCDAATFNEALGPGACVKDGNVTFAELVGQLLSMGEAPAWRNAPEHLGVADGGTIRATNRGGEFHTFTPVEEFGGGCVDDLNALLGLEPVAECANPFFVFVVTGIAPGETFESEPLGQGTHLFECLIHPWMQTTVTVD
jgi:hypothetical protein